MISMKVDKTGNISCFRIKTKWLSESKNKFNNSPVVVARDIKFCVHKKRLEGVRTKMGESDINFSTNYFPNVVCVMLDSLVLL